MTRLFLRSLLASGLLIGCVAGSHQDIADDMGASGSSGDSGSSNSGGSGPGKNYYPTDKLHKGEKVEIYRHDPGGWCAIKPPRQSFSWVSASPRASRAMACATCIIGRATERTMKSAIAIARTRLNRPAPHIQDVPWLP